MNYEEACKKLNSCKYLYLERFGQGDKDLDLHVEVVEARPQETLAVLPLASDNLEHILGPGSPIERDAKSAHFTLVFRNYLAVSIINESYCSDDGDTSDEKSFKNFCVCEKSRFRDYVSAVTFADDNFPGPQKHFTISCLNHILNVVCQQNPVITVRTLGEIQAS